MLVDSQICECVMATAAFCSQLLGNYHGDCGVVTIDNTIQHIKDELE